MEFNKKILIAIYIDTFVIAFVLALLQVVLNIENVIVFMLFYFALAYLLFMFFPLMFKNASIGMLIMELRIVDKDYKVPHIKLILKRGIFVPLLGFAIFRSRLGYIDNLFEWEIKHYDSAVVSEELQKH